MQQTRRVLILTLVLFFFGISSVWAAGISFTDPDGNWWQNNTVDAGGSISVSGAEIQLLLADLADGTITGTYNILSGVNTATSGIADVSGSAPDAGLDGDFSLADLASSTITIAGTTNGGIYGDSFTLGTGNIYYSYTLGQPGKFNLDIMFLQACDNGGGYVYAGMGIDNVESLSDLQYIASKLLTDPNYTYNLDIAPNSNIDVIYGTTCSSVPIPGAVWLLGSGLFGLIGIRRRKNQLQA